MEDTNGLTTDPLVKLVQLTPTVEGIPLGLYEGILTLAITATVCSIHTITIPCAKNVKNMLVADVDVLKELLLLNHQCRNTITKVGSFNFANSTTQVLSRDVIAKLIDSRQYPPFHK